MLMHFQTVWNLLTRGGRIKLVLKTFLLCGMGAVPLVLGESVNRFIMEKTVQHGYLGIMILCLFIDVLLLWVFRLEISNIHSKFYSESQYSFYRHCEFNRRSYRLLPVVSSMPYAIVSLVYGCAFTFPLFQSVVACIAFLLAYLALLFITVWSDTKGDKRKKTTACRPWRNRFLQKKRFEAVLTFSIAGESVLPFLLLTMVLGALSLSLSMQLWIAFYVCSCFSSYFALLRIDRHYRNRSVFQMLQQRYVQLIFDDVFVSIIFFLFTLLFLGMLVIAMGYCFDNLERIAFGLLAGVLNHFLLYAMFDIWLPDRNAVQERAPLILLLIFLLIIPGMALLLLIPFLLKNGRQLLKPICWRKY